MVPSLGLVLPDHRKSGARRSEVSSRDLDYFLGKPCSGSSAASCHGPCSCYPLSLLAGTVFLSIIATLLQYCCVLGRTCRSPRPGFTVTSHVITPSKAWTAADLASARPPPRSEFAQRGRSCRWHQVKLGKIATVVRTGVEGLGAFAQVYRSPPSPRRAQLGRRRLLGLSFEEPCFSRGFVSLQTFQATRGHSNVDQPQPPGMPGLTRPQRLPYLAPGRMPWRPDPW